MTVHDTHIHDTHMHGTTEAPAGPDAEIAHQVREHHALMVAGLDRLTVALLETTPAAQEEAHRELSEWFEQVLVPHADEEEATTYDSASRLPEGRPLITAMVREHVLIKRLVTLFNASQGEAAAAYGRAVFEAFDSHQGKENDVILPMLVEAPQVSLAEVMGGHSHQVGEDAHHGHHHGHDHAHDH